MGGKGRGKQDPQTARHRVGVHTPVGELLKIPMTFEVLLHDELGLAKMLHIHNGSSLDSWRECLGTCFESLVKVVRDTVHGDSCHKADLIDHCRISAKDARRAKTHEEALTSAVGDFAMLAFLLLGRSAVQRGTGRGGRRNWALTRYRSMFYTRDGEPDPRPCSILARQAQRRGSLIR